MSTSRFTAWLGVVLALFAAPGCTRCAGPPQPDSWGTETCAVSALDAGCATVARARPECVTDSTRLCALAPGEGPVDGGGILSGEVVDGNTLDFPKLPGAAVLAWVPGAREATRAVSANDGSFSFSVPLGLPVFFRADLPGYLPELHAATVTQERRRRVMDVDLRKPPFFDAVLKPLGRKFEGEKGLVVVEFIGARGVAGPSATLSAKSDPPFVFDAPFLAGGAKPVTSPELLAGGEGLLVFTGVEPGLTTVRYRTPEGLECRSHATVEGWPVRPGVITQIDAVCSGPLAITEAVDR